MVCLICPGNQRWHTDHGVNTMAKVSTFRTTVAGVSYRQEMVARCWQGAGVKLIRNPRNKHDKNAIEVHVFHRGQIGFIPRETAQGLASSMDDGDKVEARIAELTGGTLDKPTMGVTLQITITSASLIS